LSAYHAIEVLIVGGVVAYAAWNLAARFIPKLRGKSAAKSAGCDGCSGGSCCDSGSSPKVTPDRKTEHPLRFHR